MYTISALASLWGATAAMLLIVMAGIGHFDFWNYDTALTPWAVVMAACVGCCAGAVGGVGAERDTKNRASNGGCLLYASGFLGMFLFALLIDQCGGPALYMLMPVAGLCLAATASHSGLSVLLFLGCSAWLACVQLMLFPQHPFNQVALYNALLFPCLFLACGFIRSKVDWKLYAHQKLNYKRTEAGSSSGLHNPLANQPLGSE